MAEQATVAVVGGTIIDGTGGPSLPNGTVVIEGDRISAVGTGIPAPADATVVDAAGRYVIPGLVDMHVHVLPYGELSLACYLGTGVTSVRDVGGEADAMLPLRQRVAAGEIVGPRIFTYGPLLDWDPPRIGPDAVLGFIARPHDDLRALADSVNRLIERGVDGLKCYAGLTPDAVKTVIDTAAGRVPVTGHLGLTWASEAIELGINCLEHLLLTLYQDIARPEDRHGREAGSFALLSQQRLQGWARADLNADYVNRLIDLMVERRVALSPTTVLATGGLNPRPGDDVGEKYRRAFMQERDRLAEERLGHPPAVLGAQQPPVLGLAEQALAQELRFIEKLHKAGGIIVPSTDTGAVPAAPGFALHRELLLLSEAGIPNHDVLQAGTRVAAEVLRHGDELGTIQPGTLADLVVLDADPLADIRAVGRTHAVIKNGRVYDPQELLARIPA